MTKKAVPKFLVELNSFDPYIEGITEACKDLGYEVQTCKYIPFELGDYNKQYSNTDCVVFFGSINLARHIMRTKGWIPGAYCNLTNFLRSHYQPYFGNYFLRLLYDNSFYLPWGELKKRIQANEMDSVANPSTGGIFVRPDDGAKSFTGQVIKLYDHDKDIQFIDSRVKPETLVYITSEVKMKDEYRLFVADSKIVTGSRYRKNGELSNDPSVPSLIREAAEEMLSQTPWRPERLFTMDIHHDPEINRIGLIELNCFSCSGLYAANPKIVVSEAARVACEEWEDIENI